ncbi:hypothetical protein, conserved [Leishmania tarentolae]|uniref:Uncharacterized protein n=1 Tax=Leishmania tarentolae TaxID=5689 RepID=A0A640L1V1_LEITA|nr:hypothetical protein, conserved [Leishmania tarentolae]
MTQLIVRVQLVALEVTLEVPLAGNKLGEVIPHQHRTKARPERPADGRARFVQEPGVEEVHEGGTKETSHENRGATRVRVQDGAQVPVRFTIFRLENTLDHTSVRYLVVLQKEIELAKVGLEAVVYHDRRHRPVPVERCGAIGLSNHGVALRSGTARHCSERF